MAVRAIQQMMIGNVCKSEKQTLEALKRIKAAGYDGIELNQFMTEPTAMIVRVLTKAAGMPVGKGGKWRWKELIDEAGLSVVSFHTDLGSLEREPDKVYEKAKKYGTDKIVITGMYRFDYRSCEQVTQLAQRLNQAGESAKKAEFNLLYHNHNVEFTQVEERKTAYDILLSQTDGAYLNFEFDSYWPAEAGVDIIATMEKLGDRMVLYHINDRGTRLSKIPMTPLLTSDSMELGYGNMPLTKLVSKALSENVAAIILESHKNWIDNDPLKSMEMSGVFMREHVK